MSDPGKGGAPAAPPAWFFVEDGKVVGPLSAEDLAACVRAGRVARETLVAPSGSSAWVSAGQIDGLLTPSRPMPPGEATVVSRPADDDLATSDDMEDDVATSDTLGDVSARSASPRRARPRARTQPGAREGRGRRSLVIAAVAALIVIAVVAAFVLLREPPPSAEPVAARPAGEPSSADAPEEARGSMPATDATEGAARSGVVAAEAALPVDAVARAKDSAEAEIARLQAAYQAQVASFASAGGLDPARLRTAADIDARLQQVARLRQENLALERALLDIAQGLRAGLVEQGVAEAQAATLARTAQEDLRITPLVQACRLDDEAWAASDDLLGTLRGTLGHWHVRADGSLEFDSSVSPATYAGYASAIERIEAAARGQQDLATR